MSTDLIDEPVTKKAPKPVVLRSAHDYGVATGALKVRCEQLKKLAEKTASEGYAREGKAIQADADAIEHHILPQFAEQKDLDLVDHESLQKEVVAALRVTIFRAFDGMGDPKHPPTASNIEFRRDNLLKVLSEAVTMFARDVADESYNEGYASRNTHPEALAARSIASLRPA